MNKDVSESFETDFGVLKDPRVNGGHHMEAIEYERRTAYLIKQGYKVLRVWNNEVFNDIEGVLATILNLLENRST